MTTAETTPDERRRPQGAHPAHLLRGVAAGRCPKHFAADGDLILSHLAAVAVRGVPRRRGLLRPLGPPLPRPDHRPRAQAPGRRLHRPGGDARPRAPGVQRPPRRARLPDQAVRALHQEGPRHPRAAAAADVQPRRHRRARALHRHARRARADATRRPATCSATTRSTNLFLWHALEESEHKAVAFDVYKAVGGSERIRVLTMNLLRFGFVVGMAVQVVVSLLGDRDDLPPRQRCAAAGSSFRRSPFVQPRAVGPAPGLQPPRLPPRRPRHHRARRAAGGPSCSATAGTLNDKLASAAA